MVRFANIVLAHRTASCSLNLRVGQEWGIFVKLEFIPKVITLLAGAIVSVTTIVNDMDVTYSLELLLATLIIFYIIGIIAKKIIQKVMEGNMFIKRQDAAVENIDVPQRDEDDMESNGNMKPVVGDNE